MLDEWHIDFSASKTEFYSILGTSATSVVTESGFLPVSTVLPPIEASLQSSCDFHVLASWVEVSLPRFTWSGPLTVCANRCWLNLAKFGRCNCGKLQTIRRLHSPPTPTHPQIVVGATLPSQCLSLSKVSRFACFSCLLKQGVWLCVNSSNLKFLKCKVLQFPRF